MPFNSPYVLSDFGQTSWANDAVDGAQLVLKVYTTAMRTSLTEQEAFEAAVKAYRARNPKLAERAARRTVASIICGKL